MTAGICSCGHTRRHHHADEPHRCKATRCGCIEYGDIPDTPVRRSFRDLSAAHDYATGAAKVQGKKWFVCRRVGKWYAIEPGMANAVRANPKWPGRALSPMV